MTEGNKNPQTTTVQLETSNIIQQFQIVLDVLASHVSDIAPGITWHHLASPGDLSAANGLCRGSSAHCFGAILGQKPHCLAEDLQVAMHLRHVVACGGMWNMWNMWKRGRSAILPWLNNPVTKRLT